MIKKRINLWMAIGVIALSTAASPKSFGFFRNKVVAFDVTGGVPNLIALQARYMGLQKFEFGAGIGFLPVNGILNSLVPLASSPVSAGFETRPNATYNFFGAGLFARWKPMGDQGSGGGFFVQAAVNYLGFLGSINADVVNTSNGATVPAYSGSAQINQMLYSIAVGWQFVLSDSIFLETALGISYKPTPTRSVDLSEATAESVAFTGGSAADINSTRGQIESQIDDGLSQYDAISPVLPVFFLAIGYAF